MVLLVCVDENGGMAFNNRRQSKDSAVTKRVLKMTENKVLRMSEYSKKMFGDAPQIQADEDFLQKAGENDYCFAEVNDVSSLADRVNRIILFKWNRSYPFDLEFNITLDSGEWKLCEATDFTGSSHERITEEVYEKRSME